MSLGGAELIQIHIVQSGQTLYGIALARAFSIMEYGKPANALKASVFAFQTFLSKVTAGIAGVATGIVLDRGGYIEPYPTQLDAMGKQILATRCTARYAQTATLSGNGFTSHRLCAHDDSDVFSTNYTGKRKEKIQQELNERHEQHETEKAEAGQ